MMSNKKHLKFFMRDYIYDMYYPVEIESQFVNIVRLNIDLRGNSLITTSRIVNGFNYLRLNLWRWK